MALSVWQVCCSTYRAINLDTLNPTPITWGTPRGGKAAAHPCPCHTLRKVWTACREWHACMRRPRYTLNHGIEVDAQFDQIPTITPTSPTLRKTQMHGWLVLFLPHKQHLTRGKVKRGVQFHPIVPLVAHNLLGQALQGRVGVREGADAALADVPPIVGKTFDVKLGRLPLRLPGQGRGGLLDRSVVRPQLPSRRGTKCQGLESRPHFLSIFHQNMPMGKPPETLES